MESDKADLAGLVLSVKEATEKVNEEVGSLKSELASKGLLADGDGAKGSSGGKSAMPDVTIFAGYFEKASRLVFHYGDNFAESKPHVEKRT